MQKSQAGFVEKQKEPGGSRMESLSSTNGDQNEKSKSPRLNSDELVAGPFSFSRGLTSLVNLVQLPSQCFHDRRPDHFTLAGANVPAATFF